MRLGIGSYTYGWDSGTYGPELTRNRTHLSAFDLIDRAAAYGLPVVQMVVKPALDEMSDDELGRLAAYAREKGVEVETGTTGSDPERLSRWLRVSRMLGAGLMRTLFADSSPGLKDEKSRLGEILPEFRKAGVSIAVENHERYSYRELLALLDGLDNSGVGVCLDTVNSLGRGEGTWEVANALLPRTLSLHIKDYTATRGGTDMGFTITGTITGEGRLDIPALLTAMNGHRPEVSVILEQWTPITRSVEHAIREQERWAETGVAFLKAELRRLELEPSPTKKLKG
jgi:sugar phosphate isomerase/epimerase